MRAIDGTAVRPFLLPARLAFLVLATVALTVGAVLAMHAVATSKPHAHPVFGTVAVAYEDATSELDSGAGYDNHQQADCSDHNSLRDRHGTTVEFADQAPAVLDTHVFLASPDISPVLSPKPDEPSVTEVALVTELSVSRI